MHNWKRLVTAGLIAGISLTPAMARKKKALPEAGAQTALTQPMNQDEKVLHALNRLAFGPRPGDADQIKAIGLNAWITQQLHPAQIPENTVIEVKLQPLDTLRMSAREMVEKYPPNPIVKQMVDGRVPWPSDPITRIVVQRQAKRYADKLNLSAEDQNKPPSFDEALAALPTAQQQVFRNGKPEEKAGLLESLPVDQQFNVVIAMPPPQRQKVFQAATLQLRRRMQTFGGMQQLVNQDLQESKIVRAVYSNRQLDEVLTDFWFNHFNINADKGADRYSTTGYERDAIRPYVLGKFKDLLLATAESPAMLFYLDNFQSVKPDMAARNPKQAKRGLNENYGRELMELHTLGVDGGYTQQDVTEVARCFTGWTIRQPQKGGEFEFNPKQHDSGEKHVLGVTIPAGGGIDDGYKVIDILVHHPATARFISKSLATRFVSDNPPASLVDRMAATFKKTDGDLRAVMKSMIDSKEFWDQSVYRAKIKSPFEMMISALRATNADVDFTYAIAGQLNQLGEPLYRKVEPTGYSNKSAEWMNSAALLGRMNFALNLTANKVGGVKVTLPSTTDPRSMAQALLGTDLTPDSLQIVQKGLAAEVSNAAAVKPVQYQAPLPALVAGLTLGSPDFQRR